MRSQRRDRGEQLPDGPDLLTGGEGSNNESLRGVLSGMMKCLDGVGPLNVELDEKLAAFEKLRQERVLDELAEEFDDWEIFNERLLQLKRFYKRGLFDDRLGRACLSLHRFLNQAKPEAVPEYWKARTLVYELNDIFNKDSEINELAYRDGESVVGELRSISVEWDDLVLSEDERSLIREKVLFCSCRGNELKRRGD